MSKPETREDARVSGANHVSHADRSGAAAHVVPEEPPALTILECIRSVRGSERVRLSLLLALAVAWVGWQSWIAITVAPSPVHARSMHLAFAFATGFVMLPGLVAKRWKGAGLVLDILLGSAAVISLLHLYLSFNAPDFRRVVNPEAIDIILGVVLLVVMIIALWRVTGLALAIMVLVAIAYALLGQFIPGAAGHAGFAPARVLSILYLQLDGILGSTTGASATTIFPVLIFGSMLLSLGGGHFFTQLAIAGFGRTRGAGGKIATVASALFSTVTGTGGSGVAATGTLTIPLMKRTGYTGVQASGIESAASVGGQILPPIMGASAFAMAEFLSVPYSEIVTHAVIPGVLYFVTVFVLVHLEARRMDVKPLPRSEIPRARTVLGSGWHFLLPLVMFVLMIAVAQISVARAAIWSTLALILLEFGRRVLTRRALRPVDLLDGCIQTVRGAVVVGVAVAGIQVLIAVVGLTGLGIKLSSLLLALSGGSIVLLLILTMFASIVLGTGLPTLPTYLVLAVLVAPALTDFGIPLIAAHLFILYFGVFSDLTPPTALGPTIAAGIAGAPVLKSMISAMKYGLLGFVLPYMFVASPGLLMIGSAVEVVVAVALTLVVIAVGGAAIVGFGLAPMSPAERIVAGVAAAALAVPMLGFRIPALVVVVALIAWQLRRGRAVPRPDAPSLPSPKTRRESTS